MIPLALALAVTAGDAFAEAEEKLVTYRCADDKEILVRFDAQGQSASLKLKGKTRRLALVPAASGAKYTDGTVVLWTKGREAFVERDGRMLYADCKAFDPS